MDETFFVDLDSERNRRRLQYFIEEQFRIAYASQGAISYHEVGVLTTEERQTLVNVIKKIKDEERKEMEEASGKSQKQYSDLSEMRFSSTKGSSKHS